jgi:hypothetical protein
VHSSAVNLYKKAMQINPSLVTGFKSIPASLSWSIYELIAQDIDDLLKPIFRKKSVMFTEEVIHRLQCTEGEEDFFHRLERVNRHWFPVYEVTKYSKEKSGLPYDIWFDFIGKDRRKNSDIPRIKVLLPSGVAFPVSIEDDPKIIEPWYSKIDKLEEDNQIDEERMNKIYRFIKKYKDVLIRYWNKETDERNLMIYIDIHK